MFKCVEHNSPQGFYPLIRNRESATLWMRLHSVGITDFLDNWSANTICYVSGPYGPVVLNEQPEEKAVVLTHMTRPGVSLANVTSLPSCLWQLR